MTKVPSPPAVPPFGTAVERNFHQSMLNAVRWLLANHPQLAQPVAQTHAVTSDMTAAPAQFGVNVLDTAGNVVTQITGDLLATQSVDSSHFVDGAVGADAIDTGAINSDHIAADSINATHVGDQTLSDVHIIATESTVAAAAITLDPTTGVIQIDISRAATDTGTGVEGIINADTQYLVDNAGLGITGDATSITNLPVSVDAAVALGLLLNVQKSVGVASAVRQALMSDGSTPYWDDPLGGTVDGGVAGATNFLPTDVNLTSTMTTVGNKWVIQNSFGGRSITVLAWLNTTYSVAGGTSGDSAAAQLQISLDGGSTWTTSAQIPATRFALSGSATPGGVCMHSVTGVPTGSVQIRAQANAGGVDTVTLQSARSALCYVILNSGNGVVTGNTNLAASLPATSSMSCGSTYPTSSCTASRNLTVTTSGGLPGYLWSNAKTAGSGTMTSGATAQTFTVQDTETTTSGGATHTTSVQSTVTDSQSYTSAAGSESGTTATLTLNASALIAVGTTFDVSATTPAGYAKTGAVALTGTTGTTLKYTANSSGLAALTAATISNIRIVTNTCVVTGTFTLNYSAISVSVSKSGGFCSGVSVDDGGTGGCTATVSCTTNASGGDGLFSYANVKLSGDGTVASGATSKTWKATDSGMGTWSGSGSYKSTVTDGHSNTGSKTLTLSFSGSL